MAGWLLKGEMKYIKCSMWRFIDMSLTGQSIQGGLRNEFRHSSFFATILT